MSSYSVAEINAITGGHLSGDVNHSISHLVYDSRKIQHSPNSLFFALQTSHGDGHQFIEDAYKKGVQCLCS